MEEYQLVVPQQVVLLPIPVIVDVHRLEVKQEPVRVMEHGVAVHQLVNVCDIYSVLLCTIVLIIFCIIIVIVCCSHNIESSKQLFTNVLLKI